MKIATIKDMQNIDKQAIEKFKIAETVLMENAGHAVANVTANLLGDVEGKTVCVLAGTGNNGGDAFVAARHLANKGATVKIFLLGSAARLKPSAAINRDICVSMGLDVYSLLEERDWDKLSVVLKISDAAVDGILGTGFTGEMRAETKRLIELVNSYKLPIVAIDIPSGVNANTGTIGDCAIKANMTVTFGVPKGGHFFGKGAVSTGELIVDDIGIPASLLNDEAMLLEYFDDNLARAVLKMREVDVHKGDCGKILVIAGSTGMTGAAALCSTAALKIGAGLVTLAVAESLNDILEAKLTEVMTLPLPETEKGVLGESALRSALAAAEKADVVLIGPGLGRKTETIDFIRDFCRETKTPLILDADALYAFIGSTDEIAAFANTPVLTPHLGEMASLLDITVDDLRHDIIAKAQKASEQWNAIIVLKSECTITVCPGGNVWMTSKGNPAMATAGSGDVLAGTIAGLVKQLDPGMAPLLGVYLHGLAGDLAAEKKGEGLIASDILKKLPTARMKLAEKN